MTLFNTVFVHSTGLGPFMWKPYIDRLNGLSVSAPVNLGYAPDERVRPPRVTTLQDDIAHLRRQIPAKGPVHLVGHSWGATMALELARSGQIEVASMWLYEPVLFGSLLDIADSLEPTTRGDLDEVVKRFRNTPQAEGGNEHWLEAFVDYWNGPGAWRNMGERARQSMRGMGWKMFQEVRGVFEDTRPFGDYASTVPTTLVVGGRSPRPARAMGFALAAVLPQAVVHDEPTLGHMGLLTDPSILLPRLRDHFARQPLA